MSLPSVRLHAALTLALAAGLSLTSPGFADTVTLSTGETLQGVVVSQNAREIVFNHAVLGRMTLSRNAVRSFTLGSPPANATAENNADAVSQVEPQTDDASAPTTTDAATDAATDTSVSDAATDAPVDGDESWFDVWMRDWTTQFELGLTGSSGNSESLNLRVGFSTSYEDELERWVYSALYQYETSDGDPSTNAFTTDLTKDWFIPESPWYVSAKAGYQWDQFESWRHRVTGSVGPGYYFIREDDLELRGSVSPAFTKDFGGDENFSPEMLVAMELLKWKIDDVQTINAAIEYRPSLEAISDYRVNVRAEYQLQLQELGDDFELAYLKLGAELEHESDVEPDEDRNDVDYYASIVFEF